MAIAEIDCRIDVPDNRCCTVVRIWRNGNTFSSSVYPDVLIGRDFFSSPTRQNLPCSVSSAFNVFPSQHFSSHLSTSSHLMTLVSWAIHSFGQTDKHFLRNYLYAKDNRMHVSATGTFRYQKRKWWRSMWHIECAWSDSKRSISRNSQIKWRLEQLSRGMRKRTWMDSEPWHVIFAIHNFMNGDPTHRERRTVRHAFNDLNDSNSHKLNVFLSLFFFGSQCKNVPFRIGISTHSPYNKFLSIKWNVEAFNILNLKYYFN